MKNVKFSSQPAPISTDEALEMKGRIEQALQENAQAKEWVDEYGDMTDVAEIEILEAKLRSTLEILNHFIATGEWNAPAGAAAESGDGGDFGQKTPRNLTPGWNGDFTLDTEIRAGEDGLDRLVAGAEFAGKIYINETGHTETDEEGNTIRVIELAFQGSATTQKIEAFNRGSDIVYVETYLDESGAEKKRYWVGKNHATHTGAHLSISAINLDHGVTIDLSGVYRVSDGSFGQTAGTRGQILVFGSDHDDVLIGSQSEDILVGLKGNDRLYGMGGADEIYGDDGYWEDPLNGLSAEQVRRQLGMATDLADGDDFVDGGAGKDVMDGGGGINTGVGTDAVRGANAETRYNVQHTVDSDKASPRGWFGGPDAWVNGWEIVEETPGMAVVGETEVVDGVPNNLVLNIPEGFDMAFAEERGEDLAVTFVKQAEGENAPETFTVIIKGALRDRTASLSDPFLLTINGNDKANIIDFQSVDFGNNFFQAFGKEGDDMIMAPKTALGNDGLSVADLTGRDSRISDRETEQLLDLVVPGHGREGKQKNVSAVKTGKGEITISKTDGYAGNSERTYLQIDPQDFDKAYTFTENNGRDLVVVLVRRPVAGGEPQTLVLRIKDYDMFHKNGDRPGNLDFLVLNGQATYVDGKVQPAAGAIDLIPLTVLEHNGQLYSGVLIFGGAGNDTALHYGEGFSDAEAQLLASADFAPEPAESPKEPEPPPNPGDGDPEV